MKRLWLLLCVPFGHQPKQCGRACYSMEYFWPEYEEWWECTRCGEDLSSYYDESTFIGRLKSWWYQE